MNGRLRRYAVDTQELVGLFNLNTRFDQISIPIIESMPIDAVVVSCYFDYPHQAVVFIVSHPSFNYVEEFHEIPFQPAKLLHTVLLVKEKDVWKEQIR